MTTYFCYILGATLDMIESSAPYSNMKPYLSVSMWIYTPGMSNVATSWTSCALTTSIMNTDSVVTVDKPAPSLLLSPTFFYHKRIHVPLCFHYDFLLGTLVIPLLPIFVASTGEKVSRILNCDSYLVTYSSPCYLNLLKTVFSTYFFMMMCSMWLSLLY